MSESSNTNPQKNSDLFSKLKTTLETEYKDLNLPPIVRVTKWLTRWLDCTGAVCIEVDTWQRIADSVGEGMYGTRVADCIETLHKKQAILLLIPDTKHKMIFSKSKVINKNIDEQYNIYDLINSIKDLSYIDLRNYINKILLLINKNIDGFTFYFSKDGGIEVTGRDEMMSKVKSTFADPEIVKVYQEFENLHWKYKHRRVHVKRDHKANETTAKYILQLCSEYNQFNSRKGMEPITPKRFIDFTFRNWYPFGNGIPLYFSMLTSDSLKTLWSYAFGDFPLAMSKTIQPDLVDRIKFNRQQFMKARGYMTDEEWQYCLSEMKCTEKQYYEFLADGCGMYKLPYSKVFPERIK